MIPPFVLNIMPVKATYRWNDVTSKWHVTVSRQIAVPPAGQKREISRQSFEDYGAALTFVSVFWGNG